MPKSAVRFFMLFAKFNLCLSCICRHKFEILFFQNFLLISYAIVRMNFYLNEIKICFSLAQITRNSRGNHPFNYHPYELSLLSALHESARRRTS